MNKSERLIELFKKYQESIVPIVPVDFKKEKYITFDFSENNKELEKFDLTDIQQMNEYVFGKIEKAKVKVGVGGYNEERAVYQKSKVFQVSEGSRSIHLGVDLWMKAGTEIFTPLNAKVHSFQNNDHFGDYGPTIILEHDLEGIIFYTLYGHLSLNSLEGLYEGRIIEKGEKLGEIGSEEVNGNWTSHLHFQVITDMLGNKGDFIGVADKLKREYYLNICPNPNFLLGIK